MNILPAIYKNDVFDVSGQLLPVPSGVREKVELRSGQSFDLGIRPEHIYIQEPQTPGELTQEQLGALSVQVKVVEPLGRETLIRASLPGSMTVINIQTSADVRPRPGDQLSLQLDLNHLFIFDTATGDRLWHSPKRNPISPE
jgi:multiple sugar transport system ATP-binding protein